MTKEKAMDILNRLIDDLIDIYGIYETIERLIDFGVTDEELFELGFNQDDIEVAKADLEESEED